MGVGGQVTKRMNGAIVDRRRNPLAMRERSGVVHSEHHLGRIYDRGHGFPNDEAKSRRGISGDGGNNKLSAGKLNDDPGHHSVRPY